MRAADEIPTEPARQPDGLAPPGAGPSSADRYLIGDRLGEGAMGVVWEAHDRVLDRPVALKLLHDRFLGAYHQDRLTAEARAMARLSHPNVVAVYDAGEREGRAFLAMELVRGTSVARWAQSPRGWSQVVEVFRDAGAGVAAAHAAGIVHGDLKPSNILLGEDGRARVADFGVASADDGARPPTADDAPSTAVTASVAGTPAYFAPERFAGAPADARTDQFAFAVAFYEVLHGRRPFAGADLPALAASVAAGAPPPLRPVPGWLHAVIARALAADPADRFPSMDALVVALAGPRRPRRRLLTATGGLVAAAGAVGWLALAGAERNSCPAGTARVEAAWGVLARTRLAAGFAATGLPYATASANALVGQLDRYAGALAAAYDHACRAPTAERARRVACLDQRLEVLARVPAALTTGDREVLTRATRVVPGLPSIAACADPGTLSATATTRSPAVAAATLARVGLLGFNLAEARARAEEAIGHARAEGERAVEAEALLTLGRVAAEEGQLAEAVDHFTAGASAASDAGVLSLRGELLASLSQTLQRQGRLRDAERVLAEAEADAARFPDPARQAAVALTRGTLLGRQGKYAEALAAFDQSEALTRSVAGADAPELSRAQSNRAVALRQLGRVPEALAAARRALELTLPLGDAHPDVSRARREVAIALSVGGDYQAAHVELERALAAMIAAVGPDHLDVAGLREAVAINLGRLGRDDEVVEHLRAAVAVDDQLAPGSKVALGRRATLALALVGRDQAAEAEPMLRAVVSGRAELLGRDHPDVALAHQQLAEALRALGRHDDALAELRQALAGNNAAQPLRLAGMRADEAANLRALGRFREALAADQAAWDLRRERLADGHPDRALTLTALADDELGLGRAAHALAHADAAVAAAAAAPPPVRARATFSLARARWATGDRAAALTLARSALADGSAALRRDVEAWLARHAR